MKKTLFGFCVLVVWMLIFWGQSGRVSLAANPTPHPDEEAENKAYLYEPLFSPSNFTQAQILDELGEEAGPFSPKSNLPTWWVFQAILDDNFDVFLGGNGEPVRLTYDGASDVLPRLNHGATKITFISNRGGDFEIFTMNPNGSEVVQLTNTGGENLYPYWSPDGTKIVFQSDRDGQAEIYVMNADGSNPVRLTYDGDYDGQPSFSPDGSKIAFISRRTGGYRVYTMNPDGSEVVQLSTQAYSAHPVWSPDGTMIAYDADGDANGWQDLYLMNVDGSNQHNVSNLGAVNYDKLVSGWMSNSAETLLLYTQVSWIYYDDQWYWYQAFLRGWDVTSPIGSVVYYETGNTNWLMDYQSSDGLPPESSLSALPGVSPGQFAVAWFGEDLQNAVQGYQVQVKIDDGNWNDWKLWTTETTATYAGIGGKTYSFRVRSRDTEFNWEAWPAGAEGITTVESSPPQTSLLLSSFLRVGTDIHWTGTDPGDSGILNFDLEYRLAGTSDWNAWLTGTKYTSAIFSGMPGEAYDFRIRGTDKAQNVEAWASNGDVQTTLYTWGITGNAVDNAGVPISDLALSIQPAPLTILNGANDGAYAGYVTASASTYTVEWAKTGYGALPLTTFPKQEDAEVEVVLPPVDNVIVDGGFESGNLAPNWSPSGNLPATISGAFHTGHYGVMFGPSFPMFDTDQMVVDNSNGAVYDPQIVIGNDQTVHIVWITETELKYTQRKPDGSWSGMQETITSLMGGGIQLAVDTNGNVHIVWTNGAEIYYAYRNPNGSWSSPFNLSNSAFNSYMPKIVISADDTIHIVWYEDDLEGGIFYSYKPLNGAWSTPKMIYLRNRIGSGFNLQMIEHNGELHILYAQRDNYSNHYLVYVVGQKEVWSVPDILYIYAYSINYVSMEVGGDGIVHLIWDIHHNTNDSGVYYASHSDEGWSSAEFISGPELSPIYNVNILTRKDGTLIALWRARTDIYLNMKSANGSWGTPQFILESGNYEVKLDTLDKLHLVFVYWGVNYLTWDAQGNWSPTYSLGSGADPIYPVDFVIDSAHNIHATWEEYYRDGIKYAGPSSISENGDITLSQVLQIPSSTNTPMLSFLYRLDSLAPTIGGAFEVFVENGVNSNTIFSTTDTTNQWQHVWVNMSPWAGQTITVNFHMLQEVGYYTFSGALDDVTLGRSNSDVWVNVSPRVASFLPGREFSYEITYGNQGGAPANDVVITQTLPVGMSFVSADLSPVINGTQLVWNIGSLPAKSGPNTIIVTVTIDPQVPIFTILTSLVEINTSSDELEKLNNSIESNVFIAYVIYLPILTSD